MSRFLGLRPESAAFVADLITNSKFSFFDLEPETHCHVADEWFVDRINPCLLCQGEGLLSHTLTALTLPRKQDRLAEVRVSVSFAGLLLPPPSHTHLPSCSADLFAVAQAGGNTYSLMRDKDWPLRPVTQSNKDSSRLKTQPSGLLPSWRRWACVNWLEVDCPLLQVPGR